ncbi:hypothetical protein CesoFtcFv8_019794 [Champsocephalus esox]|uniref:Uncharacterized protein n=1 Tax=Champsocephalus esox TaxID=159716 RepID=A0AAN8BEH5_9TELE|nr:hypothetical protein CesoFtcFv8_019794 [Champsocephalus esox]
MTPAIMIIMMPISFKKTISPTQKILITGQVTLRSTTPEFEGPPLPLSRPQRTLTTRATAPVLRTSLPGDHLHHIILKFVILDHGLHIGLLTQHTTHTPEDPHMQHFLGSRAPVQG